MFGYALDQGIVSQFTVIAAPTFSYYAEISVVNTATSIIRAIFKLFISKLSNITSCLTTYIIILIIYVIRFVAAIYYNISVYIISIS